MGTENSVIEPELTTTTEITAAPKTPDAAEAEKVPNDVATPAKESGSTALATGETSSSMPDNVDYIALLFRDGLDMPISGLELFVTLPSGQMCMATSTAQGAMTLPIPAEASGLAKIEVKDVTGKRQEVCSIDLAQCKNAVIISSPKVKTDLPLRPHQQTPPPSTSPAAKPSTAAANSTTPATQPTHVDVSSPWWSANGAWDTAKSWLSTTLHLKEQSPESLPKTEAVQKTLSKAGQPVTIITAPECPNPDNLRLGGNNVYRQAILDAAKVIGLMPQALCSLIDCEAEKMIIYIPLLGADGKPLLHKKN